MKLPSPLLTKSPDTLSICGKLLAKGQPITVNKNLVGEKEQNLADKGVIKILSINSQEVQILRK